MKLYKVHIRTYNFGIVYYDLFVMADNENNMFETVYKCPAYCNDDNAEIVSHKEIDLNSKVNRVL